MGREWGLSRLHCYGRCMNVVALPTRSRSFKSGNWRSLIIKKGFIDLLKQLSVCGPISDTEFQKQYQEMSSHGDDHVICVIEDDCSSKVIATGSIFIEKKFLRNCGKVGHIEDVVVDSGARGLQLGKKIIGFLTDHAQSMGCYKVILDCSLEQGLL